MFSKDTYMLEFLDLPWDTRELICTTPYCSSSGTGIPRITTR
jgi:hypothetical protein